MGRFDDLAKAWDSKPERVAGAMVFVNKVKEHLKCDINNFKVLDYGCGSGLVSFGFANDVSQVDGLDNSFGMIEVYNEKAKKIGMDNIIGSIHDINKEDLDANQYDIVVTNMTMHHINNIEKFIFKLTNCLKVGGKLFIADLYKEDGGFHSDNTGVIHFGFEEEIVYTAFEKAGLKKIRIEKLHSIHKPSNSYDIFIAIGTKE
ncbi:MAG: class I SAM-dependent methyltransferase [Epsilonproteobacteria bacterium]|nr:class I SAM-dependent methyltransferase [Campylobacterota bacterium]